MSPDNRLKHYVLVGPGGKQAGRKNHWKIALQLAALDLTKKRVGGGIINGLLPKLSREKRAIKELVSRGYKVKKVSKRTSFRKDIREAIMNDVMVAKLLVRYEIDRGHSRLATSRVIQDFSEWVCEKLSDPTPNEIKRIVELVHDELLNMTRPDWWKKQLNQRVK